MLNLSAPEPSQPCTDLPLDGGLLVEKAACQSYIAPCSQLICTLLLLLTSPTAEPRLPAPKEGALLKNEYLAELLNTVKSTVGMTTSTASASALFSTLPAKAGRHVTILTEYPALAPVLSPRHRCSCLSLLVTAEHFRPFGNSKELHAQPAVDRCCCRTAQCTGRRPFSPSS